MPKLELIKCWKVNPEGNISEKDAALTRRLSRWPNKKNLVPFLISVLRLYQMCSNPKHITCFEVLIQPWVPFKQFFFSGYNIPHCCLFGIVAVDKTDGCIHTQFHSINTHCARVFIVKHLQGTLWIKHKILFTFHCSQPTSAFSCVCKIISI